MDKKLLEKYYKYFEVLDAPTPPETVMRSLVKMKENGLLDKIQKDPKYQEISQRHFDDLLIALDEIDKIKPWSSPIYNYLKKIKSLRKFEGKDREEESKILYYFYYSDHVQDEDLIFYKKGDEHLIDEYRQLPDISTVDEFVEIKGKKRLNEIQKELFDYYPEYDFNLWYKEENNGIDIIKKYSIGEDEFEDYKRLIIDDWHFQETILWDHDIEYLDPSPQDIMMNALPQEIIDKYMKHESNFHGDQFYTLEETDLENIIKDLEKLGYKVIKGKI